MNFVLKYLQDQVCHLSRYRIEFKSSKIQGNTVYCAHSSIKHTVQPTKTTCGIKNFIVFIKLIENI